MYAYSCPTNPCSIILVLVMFSYSYTACGHSLFGLCCLGCIKESQPSCSSDNTYISYQDHLLPTSPPVATATPTVLISLNNKVS